MPYKCDFCGIVYGGSGSAGNMSRHIMDEHIDSIDLDDNAVSKGGNGWSTENKPYKVYAEELPWDDVDMVKKKRGWVAAEDARDGD